jgi:hypothetical protein
MNNLESQAIAPRGSGSVPEYVTNRGRRFSVNPMALLAVNPSERYATTNFLEGDFRGVRDYTSTSSKLSGPLALRCGDGGKVSSEYAVTRPELRIAPADSLINTGDYSLLMPRREESSPLSNCGRPIFREGQLLNSGMSDI